MYSKVCSDLEFNQDWIRMDQNKLKQYHVTEVSVVFKNKHMGKYCEERFLLYRMLLDNKITENIIIRT